MINNETPGRGKVFVGRREPSSCSHHLMIIKEAQPLEQPTYLLSYLR